MEGRQISKRYHTSLHNDNITSSPATNFPPPCHQEPPTSNHFKLKKIFLQILPITIRGDATIVHTNALHTNTDTQRIEN